MDETGSNAAEPNKENAKMEMKAKEIFLGKMRAIGVKTFVLISSFFVILCNILPMDKKAKKAAFEKRIRRNWVAPQFDLSTPFNTIGHGYHGYYNDGPSFYSGVRPQMSFDPFPPTYQGHSEPFDSRRQPFLESFQPTDEQTSVTGHLFTGYDDIFDPNFRRQSFIQSFQLTDEQTDPLMGDSFNSLYFHSERFRLPPERTRIYNSLDVKGEEQRTCSICIEDFVSGDQVNKLYCSHEFHVTCIEPWIFRHSTCPNCRQYS